MKNNQNVRLAFDWEYITSPEMLIALSRKCQSGLTWKGSVIRFIIHRTRNCIKLSESLRNFTYTKKPLRHFTLTDRGKARLISPVHYVDRLVQKSFCENCLLPILTPTLINDNSASLKDKGTEFSRKRFKKHLMRYIRKNGVKGYFASIDYHDYFHSIDNNIAYNKLKKLLHSRADNEQEHKNIDNVLFTLEQFIFDEPGLGLGNQTSQLMAIHYCNDIDHYIKEKLRIKYYGRYMDDSYAIVKTKKEAKRLISYVRWASEKLGLSINENKTCYQPLNRPFTWLKDVYYVGPTGKINIKVKTSVYKRFKKHYNNMNNERLKEAQALSLVSYGGVIRRATNKRGFKNRVEQDLCLKAEQTFE